MIVDIWNSNNCYVSWSIWNGITGQQHLVNFPHCRHPTNSKHSIGIPSPLVSCQLFSTDRGRDHHFESIYSHKLPRVNNFISVGYSSFVDWHSIRHHSSNNFFKKQFFLVYEYSLLSIHPKLLDQLA